MMSLNRLHKTLLLIFPIFSLLLADVPAWSINPADYQYNGSVTSKVYIDGNEVGSTSDLVAAFVDGEVRGVINGLALPPFLGGGFSFNVMVFSNEAGGETVSFQYYDAANDAVIELDETLEFTSDMVVGNATAPFVLNGIGGSTTGGDDGGDTESCGDQTTWSVNPASFQYNGSVTSKVFLNEDEVGSEDDMLAAFVGDEVRGLVNGLELPEFLGGGYSFNIMIFSNEAAGEMVEFKFYQASSNTVVCLNETVDFVSDMVMGNAMNPFIFTGEIAEGNDVFGCTDDSACNYDSDATVDDESCSYAEENYDCDGNCTAGLDCAGACGGSAQFDECGICDGSGIPSGYCDCNGNIADCAGECGGSAVEDDCGVCDGGNMSQDDCGVCFGDNSSCTGCMDVDACNYDSDATLDGDCEYSEVNFDCDGNCIEEYDCAGECGGTASFDCNDECGGGASIDECGVCDGPGAIYECGCDDFPDGGAPDPGTIPENTLTVLEEDGIVNIYMHNATSVGGFQFTVNGVSATGASGGSAQDSGFMVSASGTTVIGFSLTGSTIANGSGLLTSLSGSVTGELSMSNLIISDSIGGSLDFDYFDLSAGGGDVCDCDGNILDECGECGGDSTSCEDCNGIPNGSAQLDNCGSCDDDASNDCVEDCNGTWGGSAYEITLCEDTDGDGLGNPGSEIIECVEGGRDVTDGCDLAENTVFITSEGSVLYKSTDAIGGFQFSIDGATASSASGGDAGDAGFMISAAGSTVIGFSLTGATFGPGCGTLTNIVVSGNPTSLSNLIFSDAFGGALNFSYYVESGAADMVADCSDEHPDCAANEFDCAGECGGSAVVDECGVCGGDGIADGACDCEGNFPAENEDCDGNCLVDIDCNGECGGTAYVITLCEDTDGDGLGNPDSEVTECIEGNRDVTDGCDLAENTVFITSEGSVLYNSTDAIGGFQFSINGATANGVSGGDAGAAGFMISAAGNTVIGFSLTGATFGPGCGTLADIDISGTPTSLSNLIFSDAIGGSLDIMYHVEMGDMVADCSDEYPDCTSNIVDCAGSCDGNADYDCAGVCGGSAYEANLCEDTDGDGLGNPGSEVLTCIEGSRDVTGGCDLDENTVYITASGSVLYKSTDAIGGFQFSIDGATASGASGGDAGAAGFMISAAGNTVIGFSLTGATFGPGCGTLADLDISGTPTSLSNLIFSDAVGGSLGFTYHVEAGPDLVMDCSDEYPDCAANEFDCAGECGGSAVVDECDECGGDGIDEGACDCDGNVAAENEDCDGNCLVDIDCAGECGGSASLDDCGVCNGDGSSCDPVIDFSISGGTDGSVDIHLSTTTPVLGFQFDVNGMVFNSATAASGGSAEANGFMVSTSNGGSMVLGFSLTGSTIPVGDGLLTSLTGSFTDASACLSNVIVSQDATGFLTLTGEGECVDTDAAAGCMDETACNYNENATLPGNCEYPETGFNCNGDCIIGEDCAGECGGSAVVDECGECGGDGIDDGACDCDGNIADCAGECGGVAEVDECGECGGDGIDEGACDCDGNVEDCAGDCGGSASLDDCGVCNGDNADQDCSGECFGTAEVDDCGVCGGENVDQDCNGDCFGSAYHDDCEVCVGGNTGVEECSSTQTVEIDLHGGANLISLYALPDDRSVGNIMASLEGIVTGVIGEGVAASPNPVLGWVGSLSEFAETSGYWVKVNADATLVVEDATPLDPGLEYNLHSGANLISFPYEGSVGIAEGLPDDMEGLVTGIIGEGVAASPNPVLGWVGSLTAFEGTKGYWMKMSADASFSFNIPDGLVRSSIPVEIQKTPIGFNFDQSTQQAFYFVEDIVLDGEPIQNGDWVMAYNGNVLVGAREWNGAYTDIPVMGYDSHVATAGYLENGEIPTFKVIREATGETFVLSGNLPVWTNNELYTVGVMENVVFPSTIVLQEAYPNPFNPSTNIEFGLSDDADVNVTVYDISGREMAVLAQGQFSKGFHNVIWDAADQPSGIYFVTVSTNAETQSQKLMLIK
ncbi:MAG: T9SS type A sorting domain-containing protein [Candidatus Marinimicrobia bacterium]|nr:T9SS type A sorting domain-containing protein [Candidatus Neomarinimicrobiota bacterium]